MLVGVEGEILRKLMKSNSISHLKDFIKAFSTGKDTQQDLKVEGLREELGFIL